MNRIIPRIVAVGVTFLSTTSLVVFAQQSAFDESFAEGTPAHPAPYQNPHSWDIFKQGYDAQKNGAAAQVGQHGPNCEPPGFPYTATNTHPLQSADDTVYVCNDHVMTATGLSGYSAIYMTPPAVADFSAGDATVSWQMSTLRTGARDWVDVVLTPWGEHSSFAYNNLDQHIPPHNIHISLGGPDGGPNVFIVTQRVGGGTQYGQGTDVELDGDHTTTWDDVFQRSGLTESPARRDVFAIKLSRTHLSLCMPDYSFCWVDTNLAEPLDPAVWHNQTTVMFNHRSYNVEKSCVDVGETGYTPEGDANCPPNTWHWSDVHIQPFAPYRITPSSATVPSSAPTAVSFPAAADAGAFLSFVQFSHTPDLRVSFDNGATWQVPRLQPAIAPNNGASEENGESVFTPMPAGVSSVMVRGTNGFWGTFEATDFAIYNPVGTSAPSLPTLTPTALPGTASPTTVIPLTATSTSTSTPVPATATATVTSSPATATPAPATRTPVPPTMTATPRATATPTVCRPFHRFFRPKPRC